jgi:hypothetical protein
VGDPDVGADGLEVPFEQLAVVNLAQQPPTLVIVAVVVVTCSVTGDAHCFSALVSRQWMSLLGPL